MFSDNIDDAEAQMLMDLPDILGHFPRTFLMTAFLPSGISSGVR